MLGLITGLFLAAAAQTATPPTRVVILGNGHSTQLVSQRDRAGMITAYIDRLHPDAVCIERPPELAERRDFYEFTYEVQDVVVPYVAKRAIDLCPIDWMPPVEDSKLALGMDLEAPPEVRPKSGFQSFMSFLDAEDLKFDLFNGETAAARVEFDKFIDPKTWRPDRDYPRRLYLYRTFMQGQHIAAAAHAHPGGTVLVVVGDLHQPDLEAHLAHDPAITLVKASSLGRPSEAEADRLTTRAQRLAVLSFNLLGRQAATGNLDLPWIRKTLAEVQASGVSPETALLQARLEEITGALSVQAVVARYRTLVQTTPAEARFTWTGVKDAQRIDSYFDPFGNLTVRQRATVELARLLRAGGGAGEGNALLEALKGEVGLRRGRQLDAYVADYLPIGVVKARS